MVKLERNTNETAIELELDLFGEGVYDINTGIGFFDHMLELWCKHGFIDLKLKADGDLEVDKHHTVEDIGILLGQALNKQLGQRGGITRFGDVTLPMDEVLVQAVVDLGGRSYYKSNIKSDRTEINGFPIELVDEFFRALTSNGCLNLHLVVIRNGNAHHLIEGVFKAFARAMDQALKPDDRLEGRPLSTKGSLGESGRH
ncbi:MAG: imidazoleglycerol-phosphate dehydratase HisB [Halanaerobiaceae bacterium]